MLFKTSPPASLSQELLALRGEICRSIEQKQREVAELISLLHEIDSRAPAQPSVSGQASSSAAPPASLPVALPASSPAAPAPDAKRGRLVRSPEGLQGADPPEQSDMLAARQKCEQQWYPDAPPPLCFGFYQARKGVCIWCQQCHAWVGWAKVDHKVGALVTDLDGTCLHWTPAVKASFVAAYAPDA